MANKPDESLIIATFDDKNTAEYVYNALLDMQNAEMVTLTTTSTVNRNEHGKLKVNHKHGLSTWKGAAGGVAIGFLLGGPIIGGAIGALIGRQGKGEQRNAKDFLDEKLGDDDSGIIIVIKDGDLVAVQKMLQRYNAEILEMELSAEAQQELVKAAADDEAAQAVLEEVEIVNESGDAAEG